MLLKIRALGRGQAGGGGVKETPLRSAPPSLVACKTMVNMERGTQVVTWTR